MMLADALHYVRTTSILLNTIRKQLGEYMDTMPLPEGADDIKRAGIKMWLNHYMDGDCSYETLGNVLKTLGVKELLKPQIHEMEVSESGELKIYSIGGDGE